MTGLGIIGTAAAWLNYKKAKAEYEALQEQQDGLMAAIEAYDQTKGEMLAGQIDVQSMDMPSGVEITSILRVANLVGKMFYAQPSVVLMNTSSNDYWIRTVYCSCFIFDTPVLIYTLTWDGLFADSEQTKGYVAVNDYLRAGETKEIVFDKGLSALLPEQMSELRQLICDATGKKLITSCPKVSIGSDGAAEKASIKVVWSDDEHVLKNGITERKPGTLRYCGEAGL